MNCHCRILSILQKKRILQQKFLNFGLTEVTKRTPYAKNVSSKWFDVGAAPMYHERHLDPRRGREIKHAQSPTGCLLYTSDAADE